MTMAIVLRPCDDCGGSGVGACPADTDGDGNCAVCARQLGTHACVTCIDMPWLDWREFGTWVWNKFVPLDGPEWYSNHESRKPDPSTVMHWCQVHQSAALTAGVNCYRQLHESEYGEPLDGDCDIVWIKLPTALKEDENWKHEKLQKE